MNSNLKIGADFNFVAYSYMNLQLYEVGRPQVARSICKNMISP